jgi:hypothetical protein
MPTNYRPHVKVLRRMVCHAAKGCATEDDVIPDIQAAVNPKSANGCVGTAA